MKKIIKILTIIISITLIIQLGTISLNANQVQADVGNFKSYQKEVIVRVQNQVQNRTSNQIQVQKVLQKSIKITHHQKNIIQLQVIIIIITKQMM